MFLGQLIAGYLVVTGNYHLNKGDDEAARGGNARQPLHPRDTKVDVNGLLYYPWITDDPSSKLGERILCLLAAARSLIVLEATPLSRPKRRRARTSEVRSGLRRSSSPNPGRESDCVSIHSNTFDSQGVRARRQGERYELDVRDRCRTPFWVADDGTQQRIAEFFSANRLSSPLEGEGFQYSISKTSKFLEEAGLTLPSKRSGTGRCLVVSSLVVPTWLAPLLVSILNSLFSLGPARNPLLERLRSFQEVAAVPLPALSDVRVIDKLLLHLTRSLGVIVENSRDLSYTLGVGGDGACFPLEATVLTTEQQGRGVFLLLEELRSHMTWSHLPLKRISPVCTRLNRVLLGLRDRRVALQVLLAQAGFPEHNFRVKGLRSTDEKVPLVVPVALCGLTDSFLELLFEDRPKTPSVLYDFREFTTAAYGSHFSLDWKEALGFLLPLHGFVKEGLELFFEGDDAPGEEELRERRTHAVWCREFQPRATFVLSPAQAVRFEHLLGSLVAAHSRWLGDLNTGGEGCEGGGAPPPAAGESCAGPWRPDGEV